MRKTDMVPRKPTYSSHPNHAARSAHAKGERLFKTYDTTHIRPKRSKIPLIVAIVLAIVVFLLLLWGGKTLLDNINKGSLPEGQQVEIVIPEGSGAKDIGNLLQENGVIKSSNEFVKRVGELGVDAELKPGTYQFKGGMTLDQVISVLRAGPTASYETFTVPEGFTIAQTAVRVAEAFDGAITAEEFLSCAHNASAYEADYPFVADAYDNSLEGFLFPKTYPIKPGSTADAVVRMMLAQYQTEVAALDYTFAESRGLSRYQVIVLASLIEREASLDEERPLVASVIYNRLAIDMLLQIDAAVAYAVGVIEVTPEDLAINSPYNTYINFGLPPGPICSPGLAALQAAASPADTEYFFYVAKHEGDGSHFFSSTYEEHEAYINQ